MNKPITAKTLRAVNRELHRNRFTEDDVSGLVDTGHGVISSVDLIFADLVRICERDLDLLGPYWDSAPEREP
jgi:hypothetical protein